jgi:hypothetical protein
VSGSGVLQHAVVDREWDAATVLAPGPDRDLLVSGRVEDRGLLDGALVGVPPGAVGIVAFELQRRGTRSNVVRLALILLAKRDVDGIAEVQRIVFVAAGRLLRWTGVSELRMQFGTLEPLGIIIDQPGSQ